MRPTTLNIRLFVYFLLGSYRWFRGKFLSAVMQLITLWITFLDQTVDHVEYLFQRSCSCTAETFVTGIIQLYSWSICVRDHPVVQLKNICEMYHPVVQLKHLWQESSSCTAETFMTGIMPLLYYFGGRHAVNYGEHSLHGSVVDWFIFFLTGIIFAITFYMFTKILQLSIWFIFHWGHTIDYGENLFQGSCSWSRGASRGPWCWCTARERRWSFSK